MKRNSPRELQFDFLIVGSGIAGLYAALYASKFGRVALITKSTLEESNSFWAQGGIAAVMDPEDSTLLHLEDTVQAGRGLCNEEAARILVDEGRARVLDLIALGMKFDSGERGLELGLEGGHRKRRVLHAGGNSTGKEIVQFLIASVKANTGIEVFERLTVSSLASDGKRCFGAWAYGESNNSPVVFASASTILATGGASALYERTTNPPSAVGEGIALAYRAGAELRDMEFIQFHPTALYTNGGASFLISEAVRGEGAHLINHRGERFAVDYHELGELAPRDVVSRAIFSEMRKSGSECVFLTLKRLNGDYIKRRFSNIYEACLNLGVNITEDLIPVAPAAHYTIGGVRTGLTGETSLSGLFASGEVACTGVHGANRLASNSLLECIVFAKRAVDGAIASRAESASLPDGEGWADMEFSPKPPDKERFSLIREGVCRIMTRGVGIIRSADGLRQVISSLDGFMLDGKNLGGGLRLKLENMITVSSLIAKSALQRTESRGAHIREDFPNEDDGWRKHIVCKKGTEPYVEGDK
ncbi:MAG: L-aspartate oxidase [Deltaproteobacteria bacterium]